jgi:hypothetical protein
MLMFHSGRWKIIPGGNLDAHKGMERPEMAGNIG